MLRLSLLACLMAGAANASEDIPDQYPQSVLYSKPVEAIPHVFSAIGATAPPTMENAGHNNNLSFIVTGDGVIVVNSGGGDVASRLPAGAANVRIVSTAETWWPGAARNRGTADAAPLPSLPSASAAP